MLKITCTDGRHLGIGFVRVFARLIETSGSQSRFFADLYFEKSGSKRKQAVGLQGATMDAHTLSLSAGAWRPLCDVLSAQESGDGIGAPRQGRWDAADFLQICADLCMRKTRPKICAPKFCAKNLHKNLCTNNVRKRLGKNLCTIPRTKNQGKKKHINIHKFAGFSWDWVGAKILFICFSRVIPYGGKAHKQKSPPKIPDNPVKKMFTCFFLYVVFFRSARFCPIHS